MNYITWARKNKKELIQKIVGSQKAPKQDKPIAVFMAGIPGAGKTEFIKRLFGPSVDAVKIDLDEIVKLFPNYKPERYYEYRSAAFIILDECVVYCRQHSLNFILDGTFGYKKAVDNVKKALKRHDVVIVYVWKEPTQAWRLTKDRELVEKRAINRDGFIEACIHVPENLRKIRSTFDEKVPIVAFKKNKTNDDFQTTQDIAKVDKLLELDYTKEELEILIKQ